MAGIEKRTFSMTSEQSALIDALVQRGDYATGSEVVRDGLRALQAREAAIERWLREEVVPTYERAKAHPEELISSEDMAKRMRERHQARMKAGV